MQTLHVVSSGRLHLLTAAGGSIQPRDISIDVISPRLTRHGCLRGQHREEGRAEVPSLIQSGLPGQIFPHPDTPRPLQSERALGHFCLCLLVFRDVQSTGETHTFPTQQSTAAARASGWGSGAEGRGSRLGPQPMLSGLPSTHQDSPSTDPALGFSLLLPLLPSGAVYGEEDRSPPWGHCCLSGAGRIETTSPFPSLPNPPGYLPLRSPLSSAGWQPPQRIFSLSMTKDTYTVKKRILWGLDAIQILTLSLDSREKKKNP